MRENTGPAIGVAVVLTVLPALLAWLLVFLLWTALTIYALVKWIGSAPDSASPTTVLLIVVGLVTALALLMTLPIALVGKAMTPEKRTRDDAAIEATDASIEADGSQRTETS